MRKLVVGRLGFRSCRERLSVRRRTGLVTRLGALLFLALVSSQASAQTLTTLWSFDGTSGADPYGSLTLSGGTLYGMTQRGGANNDGTVFSIPVGGGAPTTLASFSGSNGANPWGSLTLSDAILYGTTSGGGASNDGTVFSIPVSGGTPTALLSFNGTNGASPYGDLTLNGGTLYGMTYAGGANNEGTVFSVSVTQPTPEPSTLVLLGVGAASLAAYAWRRRRQTA